MDGVVRTLIHDLKYRQARFLADLAAEILDEALTRRPLLADVVLPVPLSAARRRERGYNQAELIAERLARRRSLTVTAEVLERARDTPPQVGLTAAQRRENVRGAFACTDPAAVEGRRVLLIDDVATTGATLGACAEALKAAGASRAYGLVVARER